MKVKVTKNLTFMFSMPIRPARVRTGRGKMKVNATKSVFYVSIEPAGLVNG
jgi:hypothetical protein